MGKVITVYSIKGGVAKTVSCVMLSHVLEEMGYSVLTIDLCQNGDISNTFGFDRKSFPGKNTYDWITEAKSIQDVVVQVPNKSIYFVPSDNRIDFVEDWINENITTFNKDEVLKRKLDSLKQAFDFIILDCHPSQNTLQSTMGLVASDFVFIPTTLDGNELDGAMRSAEIVEGIKDEVGCDYEILITKFESNDFGVSQEWLEEAKEAFELKNIPKFSTVNIPRSKIIKQFTAKKKTYENVKKHITARKVVKAYREVAKNLLEKEVVKNG